MTVIMPTNQDQQLMREKYRKACTTTTTSYSLLRN